MTKISKYIIPGLLVIILAVFILFANSPKDLRTAVVNTGTVESSLFVTGKVYGSDEVTVCSDVSGKIILADIQVGNMIFTEDILIKYDTSDLQKAAELARYNVDYCEMGYQAALEENEKNKAKYKEAAAKDDAFQSRYDEAMNKRNELDISQYAENTDILQKQKEVQGQILVLNKQITEKTTELSKLQLKISLATFQQNAWDMQFLEGQAEAIQEELLSLNTQLIALNEKELELPQPQMENEEYNTYIQLSKEISDISRDWTQVKTDRATAEAKILNESALLQLKDSVQIAEISAKQAQEEFDAAKKGIYAEANGVITQKYIETGAYVTKGTPLFSYQNTESYKVTVEISKYDIDSVRIGQKAQITVGNGNYEGTVDKIHYAAVTDSSGSAKVKADIKLTDAVDMIIGIEADVVISVGKAEDVIVLPQTALYSDDNGNYCYVVEKGVVEKCYITVGLKGKDGVEVLDGIGEGTHVVTDAITDAKAGERVHEKIN